MATPEQLREVLLSPDEAAALDAPGRVDAVVDVGSGQADEGYSGFEKSDLAQILRDNDIDKVTVVGLATDYCVRASALDALREGFEVTVDSAGVRGIDVDPGDSERALDEVRAAGGTVA